VIKKRKNSNFS